MAVPPRTFTWILWPSPGELSGAFDEFVIEGFRVQLRGNSLDLVFEGSGACCPDAARALAERYSEALGRRLPRVSMLITMEQFSVLATPPLGGIMTIVSPSREDRSRVARAVREVRNELLASADPALRRTYDYLQTAREKALQTAREGADDGEAMFYLYKAIETVENALGGEDTACEVLGVRKELKSVKRMASEPNRDQRHAPEDPTLPAVPTDQGQAMEQTLTVIRAYERYLLGRIG